MTQVDIAMPCYNCAPFLDAMIESILAQKGPAWRLIARDDGSTDATTERLATWRDRLGERLVVLDNPSRTNLGICGAYTAVLAATTAPHVLTADSDDVWLPGHLTRVVEALIRMEADAGSETPIAVCTDARVIDENGAVLASSVWAWGHANPRRARSVVETAMENTALGSTMALNRSLIEAALPIPASAVAQDWWLALVASGLGRLAPIREVSVLYRRHRANSTAEGFGRSTLDAARRALAAPNVARSRVRQLLTSEIAPQAGAFLDRHGARLRKQDAARLRALVGLAGQDLLARRLAILRHRLGFSSLVKTLGYWALC